MAPARRRLAIAALAFAAAAAVQAQGVSLAGRMGAKALLVIDGQTQMLGVGEVARGVRLVAVDGDSAQVERNGAVTTLRVGAAPVAVGGGARGGGAREIVIAAGPGGHFVTGGSINGRPTSFLVDTGATLISIGQGEAARIGIDVRNARRGMVGTANGAVPVSLVTLPSVRVGEVEVFDVAAVVMPSEMPYVLLGNSFLTRFQMRRDNDVLRLEQRR